jgi:hypothetical protein
MFDQASNRPGHAYLRAKASVEVGCRGLSVEVPTCTLCLTNPTCHLTIPNRDPQADSGMLWNQSLSTLAPCGVDERVLAECDLP